MNRKASVRDLHLRTSDIVRQVVDGETFIIEKQGTPVAELRPFTGTVHFHRLPDRGKLLSRLPRVKIDSGRILEQDRS